MNTIQELELRDEQTREALQAAKLREAAQVEGREAENAAQGAREAFERWWECYGDRHDDEMPEKIWKAAYLAGLKRAAGICASLEQGEFTEQCDTWPELQPNARVGLERAEFVIRAEIEKVRNG